MNYSSALFEGDLGSPCRAQQAKVRRALRECPCHAGAAVLEIGCGWGALAECAARDFGARVTGVTLSAEQLAFAQERLRHGRPGRTRHVDCACRTTATSPTSPSTPSPIEMFEAVGREYWASFFKTLRDQLKPGGRACIQTITIRDDLFERYVSGTDFIQQYIFPGGLLPSPSAFRAEAPRPGCRSSANWPSAPTTPRRCAAGAQDFLAGHAGARLGFDTRFMRIWEFYLAYCEAAFATGNTNVMQFTLRRPA
jgi:cyclopropane-fatty-acyl-phospholipid synthase